MGKLFFPKTAAGNLVRNRRFFYPYLLTGLLTVAMFYNIAFLNWHKELRNLPGGSTIPSIMSLGMIVVALFAIIFLLYTNSFLIKRRHKEIGLYNILGLSKGHIALVLFWETVYTCLITIAGGLVLGILLSKLMLLLLYKILFFEVAFGFSVSPVAMAVTAVLFGGIYLAALGRNLLHVSLSKPVELLRGGSVGEKEPKTKALLTILGLGTLGAGYYIAITTTSPLDALMLFFLAVLLVIIGTYCLFVAGSIAFLKGLKKRKSYYYQAKHFIGVSGMLYRMKQNAVGLANICILSTMVLVMISTCVCMYLGVDDVLDTMYPHEITYTQYTSPEEPGDRSVQEEIVNMAARQGLEPTKTLSVDVLRLTSNVGQGADFMPAQESNDLSDLVYTEIITADSYTQLTGQPLTLAPDQAAVYTTENDGDWTAVTVLGKTFPVAQWLETSPTGVHTAYSDRELILVVADYAALEDLFQRQLGMDNGQGQLIWEFSMDFADGADQQAVTDLYDQLAQFTRQTQEIPDTVASRTAQEQSFYSTYGSLLFLGIFLGLLFLMATVLIIYYKQISEGYEDKERFHIMEQVGMSRQQVRTAIRSQVRAVFFLPLVGAVVHLAAAFQMIVRILSALSLTNVSLFALCCLGTVVVFGVGYLIIYRLTARTYYKIVR